jgi:DNA-binding response OmpR family regulator
MPIKILAVDDDVRLRPMLKYHLEQAGYSIVTVGGGEEALISARHDRPDLVLLDIGLPDRDGLDVARTLQREMNVPIIFLTARGQETDIVVGLELGAEDYITKPFRMRELIARIRVVLRRQENRNSLGQIGPLHIGEVELDAPKREVRVRGNLVAVPPKEFELLRLLMANASSVLTTDYLLNAVWGEGFDGAIQVLYVRINWLRELIEPDPRQPRYILTVRGVGYKFVNPEGEG